MDIPKISARKIYEEITEHIKQEIMSGSLSPGEKLPSTKELSERFAVGRSTTREALSALKAMGLIEIRQGEGCYVRRIEPKDVDIPVFSLLMSKETILELLEARKSLEVANAAMAAVKRTDEDLRQFAEILDRMGSHLGDEEVGEHTDLRFHQTLAGATHNSIMVRLLNSISEQMQDSIRGARRTMMYADLSEAETLHQQHLAIFEAVRVRDEEQARHRMREHLDHVESVLKASLKNSQ
ncbi:FadR/GntR family transcriptional regulator [Ferviditalea candida]|uniref:FadR/GntR family transcriptional regulator n=1 Tax=Ferviditalea candida TaxID=3108399 RepID=A0ABU5ZI08_9BACL|nr:FadR/GntR family transcriptional regulator [Paenibacillaceae bacterium T2]